MFHKILPILFICGCFDIQPEMPVETINAAAAVNEGRKPAEETSPILGSTDNGRTWSPVGEGLPKDLIVTFMDTLGQQIVLASENYGIYLSDPQKQHWRHLDTSFLPNLKITSLHVSDRVIYAGVFRQGIFASYDLGMTWVSLNLNLEGELVKSILRVDNELWIGADDGIYALLDGSSAWRQIFNGAQVTSLLKAGNNFVAGTHKGIILSETGGGSWDWVRTGITPLKLTTVNDSIIAIYMSNEVETSTDGGATWQQMEGNMHVFDIVSKDGVLICSNQEGVHLSSDGGVNWQPVYRIINDSMLNFQAVDGTVKAVPRTAGDFFIDLMVVGGVVYAGAFRGC